MESTPVEVTGTRTDAGWESAPGPKAASGNEPETIFYRALDTIFMPDHSVDHAVRALSRTIELSARRIHAHRFPTRGRGGRRWPRAGRSRARRLWQVGQPELREYRTRHADRQPFR